MAIAQLKNIGPAAKYRIVKPTLALATHEGMMLTVVRIPRDALVTLITPTMKDSFVDLTWEGQTIMMFAQDLRACGELVIPFGHT